MSICQGIKKSGEKCSYKSKTNRFCKIHKKQYIIIVEETKEKAEGERETKEQKEIREVIEQLEMIFGNITEEEKIKKYKELFTEFREMLRGEEK